MVTSHAGINQMWSSCQDAQSKDWQAQGINAPLSHVILMQVLEKYNVVFQYLLRLKRIQVDLEAAWGVLRRQAGREKKSKDLPQQKRSLPLWHLRHHMAFIISNLQIYVQVCSAQSAGRYQSAYCAGKVTSACASE